MKRRFSTPHLSARSELAQFEPYKPGLSIQEIRRQYGLKSLVKLASNENPLGPSPKAVSAYKDVAKEIFRYPESRSVDLRRAIAEKYQLEYGEVIIGAGSDEIIELLAKTYLSPHDEIIVSASGFLQYKLAGQLMGAKVITVPMRAMKVDLDAMAKAATDATKMIFIANPNNPTGTYNTRDEVEQFLNVLPSHVLPVFDEAYFEYASVFPDYPSMIQEKYKGRPMVILRTFSKIYGLAGLRVGYGVAPEEMVAEMDKIRPPFNVSVPAQAAALAAMTDDKHVEKSVALNMKEKKFLVDELSAMGFETVPSAANFILFRVYPLKGRVLFEEMLRQSMIVRSVDEYGLPDYLRVSIGDHDQNKLFLKALREVAKK